LRSPAGAVAFVVGCAAWSVMNVLMYTFVSLRRSELLSLQNVAISLFKLAMLGGLALAVLGGPVSILLAWAGSATVGCVVTLAWQLPRAGVSPGRPRFVRPGLSGLRSAAGHHLTSAGGVLTPYLLPPLVAALLSPADNAYFALTWLMGSLFFIVAPAVSAALFAEGVRGSDLPATTRRAARLVALLLVGPAVGMVVAGRFVLSVIGEDYAREGYLLLVVLVVAALPDAVNNLAVGIYRATGRLARSATLNLAMAAVTLVGTVVLAPRAGIVGVGYAWGAAQLLGVLASGRDVVAVLRAAP
jgi:O-antigen/teichoic acid export membrane protein